MEHPYYQCTNMCNCPSRAEECRQRTGGNVSIPASWENEYICNYKSSVENCKVYIVQEEKYLAKKAFIKEHKFFFISMGISIAIFIISFFV